LGRIDVDGVVGFDAFEQEANIKIKQIKESN